MHYVVSGDGQWNEWLQWSMTSFSVYEKSIAHPYLDTALCHKTNKTRQRTCNIDKLSGQGNLCSGNFPYVSIAQINCIRYMCSNI